MEFPQKQTTHKKPPLTSSLRVPGSDSIYWKMEYSTTQTLPKFKGYTIHSQSTASPSCTKLL